MCTAIRFNANGVYFGRTLDLEYSLEENVILTPRKFKIHTLHADSTADHFAILGIGILRDGYPLYYDAMNECGVWMAGLNFPRYCKYNDSNETMLNLASFELIPYVLSRCSTVSETARLFKQINVTSDAFSQGLPPTTLHWIVCDKERCIVIEQTDRGLSIYENDTDVLTNSPQFDCQRENLTKYVNLTPYVPHSSFADGIALEPSSRGMGAFGLPGDASSPSRFVRAAFTLANASKPTDPDACVGQFYHILGSVEAVSGTVRLEDGGLDRTVYTSCADPQRLVYYYTTYENPTPNAVWMQKEDVDSSSPICYPFNRKMLITNQN